MTRLPFLLILLSTAPLHAQAKLAERGLWRAASKTASSVTGDLNFGNEKLTIEFSTFPLAQIRPLQLPEAAAALNLMNSEGSGNLFRLSVPGTKTFLHKNTLCGSDETQWVATWVAGHTLQLAFFSGSKTPEFTPEALASSTSLCGTYTYVR